ncbi:hypothetical protein B9Z55_005095 [Caenorhabditis nigoni]|uniref:Uncharacterized protein n=1 Tax=Caenorhabditis nigoni TaxID=1611254 RepID=A0A2G5UZF5_9PELO|nr:hypothetical protein B9Z55_005095 [Caenorhabditis nigoni]
MEMNPYQYLFIPTRLQELLVEDERESELLICVARYDGSRGVAENFWTCSEIYRITYSDGKHLDNSIELETTSLGSMNKFSFLE